MCLLCQGGENTPCGQARLLYFYMSMGVKIYRPIKTDWRFQDFGQNLACIKLGADDKPIRPYKVITGAYPGTCPVGTIKFYTHIGLKGHNGWDNGLYQGEPIYFPVISDTPTRWQVLNEVDSDGALVVNVYALDPIPFDMIPVHEPGAFKMIQKQYEELGGKLYPMFKFGHCLEFKRKNHEIIQSGDVIALGDSTGASSGNHLHWSMKVHNGSGFSIDSDNGYTGAFDHMPYYENKFILEQIMPRFEFKTPMARGDVNAQVGVMQSLLVKWGYMQPFKSEEAGHYGSKTQAAVLAFQLGEKVPLTSYEQFVLRGSKVGAKTMAALNKKLYQ